MKTMKRFAAALLAGVLALAMLTACSGGGSLDAKAEKDRQQIIADVNTVRTQNGLNELQENENANEIARQLAEIFRQQQDGKITQEDYNAQDKVLREMIVDGRSHKGYFGYISTGFNFNLKYWQETYEKGQINSSNTKIVKDANSKWIGVAVLEEQKGQNIRCTTFIVTY